MIKAIKVEFTASENQDLHEKIFNNIADADFAVFMATYKNNYGLTYDKTYFTITFEDNETYSGRLDANNECNTLSKHMKDYRNYWNKVSPDEFTTKKEIKKWREFFNKYKVTGY